ncbi:MAG: hypothetical protein VKJ86_07235 [Synechococcus sp.]|nr:hypothetical protein [Synechococcus sp.]
MSLSKRSWSMGLSAALCTLAGLLPVPAQAQIQISPMIIRTTTNRGMANSVINVTNQGFETQRIRVYAEPFTYTPTGFATTEISPYDLSPYLIFSPRELVLEPGQTRRVRLIARMLPSTASGEYRSVLFAEPLRERASSGQNTLRVIARLGVTVYVQHGEVTFALMPTAATYNAEKRELQLQVNNPGNGTVRPKGAWRLTQNEATIAQGDIEQQTVIAGGERIFPLPLPPEQTELAPGSYELSGELQWDEGGSGTTTPFSFAVTIPTQG